MSKQEKANIKLAYQAAAELAYMIALSLSTTKQNQTIEELIDKQQQQSG
ncbi:MAG: hypothetical protein DSM106950_33595 [Stigonema ocellatum SAG 48.90 = DSM 106950]|nr:hypothetical protein [Stigonema ocellatum SAG 48.90 = DSM 106950]